MLKKEINKDLYYLPSDVGYAGSWKKANHRSRRLVRQYGHFVRDLLLYVFWYLHKAKLLENTDRTFYLVNPWYRGYLPHYIELAKLIVPNLKVINTERNECLPESRMIKDVVKYIKPTMLEGKVSDIYYQRNHHYQKFMIDPFRDHLFKKLKFVPKVKKRLLYVPRHDQVKSQYLAARAKPQRWLEDEKLTDMLKSFCRENGYEYCRWENHAGVPLMTQIEMYSESEIIIGVTGSDFTNTYWCDDKQLIIEILPINYYSGFAPAFYSPDIELMINLQKGEQIIGDCPIGYELNKDQKRNWHIVYSEDFDEWFRHTRIRASQENRKKINKLISNHVPSQNSF